MPKTCPVCGVTYPDSNIFCATDGTTLRAADADGDLIGSVIADRYLVTDILGEGGMGKVYLARHVRLPQQAAIKVMRPEQVRDASAIARFNREAANASRIDHDRVARVYDFGETSDGIVYLAMEFVAGRTLKTILAEGGPMAPRRAANVIRQVADGLDAAHRLGIVHRDLKPDNVMLIEGEADDGSDDRVKVVDFGIAKALGGNDTGEPGLTRTGFVVGTPEFMSPEQLLGNAVDARSDVYALAILAYQCLTGTLPFDTESADRGMTARLMTAPRPLAVVREDVPWPGSVQQVFDAGLAREPAARPASAGGFARALVTAIDGWNPASTAVGAAPAPGPVSSPVPAVARPTASPTPPPIAAAAAIEGARPRGRGPILAVSAGALALAVVAAALFVRRTPPLPDPATVSTTSPPAVPVSSTAAVTQPSSAPVGTAPVGTAPVPASAAPNRCHTASRRGVGRHRTILTRGEPGGQHRPARPPLKRVGRQPPPREPAPAAAARSTASRRRSTPTTPIRRPGAPRPARSVRCCPASRQRTTARGRSFARSRRT